MAASAPAPRPDVEPVLSGRLVPPLVPIPALLCSVLLHVLLFEIIIGLNLVFFDTLDLRVRTPAEIIHAGELHEVLTAPDLSYLGRGEPGGGEPKAGGRSEGHAKLTAPAAPKPQPATASDSETPLPKAVYAGAQKIVSDPPEATNNVQTIKRPDLVAPPKLKYPIRVPSALLLPHPATSTPVLAAPPPVTPPPPAPSQQTVNIERTVEQPALVIRRAERKTTTVVPEPPKLAAKLPNLASVLPAPTRAELPIPSTPEVQGLSTKATLVLNAVMPPPETPRFVPDAEIAGSFAVLPSGSNGQPSGARKADQVSIGGGKGAGDHRGKGGADGDVAGTGSGAGDALTGHVGIRTGKGNGGGSPGDGSGKGTGSGSGTGPGNGGGSGSGTGKGHGAGTGSGSGADPGSGRGNGKGNGSGTGTGNSVGAGTGSKASPFPGVTVAGGTGGDLRLGSSTTATPQYRGTYGITIIAGGATGGAIKDLGVFARNEIVYTVYISMADAGGGNWPMQYAVLGGAAAADALLTPPYPAKKVPVQTGNPATAGREMFVRGVITENGKIEQMLVLRNSADPLARIVLEALGKWEFLPAQLNGKAVATKVLIGVVASQ